MKKLLIALLGIIIIAGAIYAFSRTGESNNESAPQISSSLDTTTQTQTFGIDEIATHNQGSDCWMAIEGNVYDVTSYIADNKHPGGDFILQGCGKEATQMFNDRPENEGPHSVQAREMLKEFYIGQLQ